MNFFKESGRKDCEPLLKEVRINEVASAEVWSSKIEVAKTFLNNGCNVKICVRPKGRSFESVEMVKIKILKFAEELSDISVIKKYSEFEGKAIVLILQFVN